MSPARGRFIVLEGGEGAGKSTQMPRLIRWLEQRGRRVLGTREPGGTPEAERIRELLLQSPAASIDATSESLLVFAARSLHLRQRVLPALEAGCDVVSDRFVDASYAYQGAGRGVPQEQLAALERWVCADLRPDLVLIFDIAPRAGRARAAARSAADRFEQEDIAFAERVRRCYLDRARQDPARYAVLDAASDPAALWQQIAQVLEERLDG